MQKEYFDLDIERSILSTCLNSNDVFEDMRELLKPSDFYSKEHEEIFSAMLLCVQNKQPINESFISKYKDVKENTMAMIIAAPFMVNSQAYANELRQMAIKRGLLNIAASMQGRMSKEAEAAGIIDKLTKDIYELSKDAANASIKDAPLMVEELLHEFELQKQRADGTMLGLDTGFEKLNSMSKGFKEGELVIIAARPGMGKTTLCLNFLYRALKDGKGVVLFSLEMPATQILQRLIAEHTSIDLQKIMTAALSDDEWSRVSDACEYFSKKKLFVYDNPDANILVVRSILRRLKAADDEIAICALDYIQLMSSSSNFVDRHLQVSEISRGLKVLARELKIPIIALSQLNRSLESRPNKRPMLSDIRESGAIEQDADTILFVYRADVYKEAAEVQKEEQAKLEGKEYKRVFTPNPFEEAAELIVGKNRHGPTGFINIVFQKMHSTFTEKKEEPSHESFSFED